MIQSLKFRGYTVAITLPKFSVLMQQAMKAMIVSRERRVTQMHDASTEDVGMPADLQVRAVKNRNVHTKTDMHILWSLQIPPRSECANLPNIAMNLQGGFVKA